MLNRYFITLGAPTTAGGKVTSSSRFETINGAPLAVEGDSCWCPACLSEGVIRPDGPRLSESIDGRQVALHDDLCICKCKPPPRLVASQAFMCQSIDSDWYAGQEAAAAQAAAQANAADLDVPELEDLPLALIDPGTMEAITGLPYRLDLPGAQGMLDHKGWTEPLSETERDAGVIVQPHAATD
ncbi:PAAR domain-containing protein [Massilia litorea]|uniref:PAAR domain-containing protein n=1 Tax=Massilia litorea TaxID=2769491 RepID=A0A7L9U8X6_9BURK|nr:PAAR domain-containing protein [Massilia litorea]QOL51501.1 PAAR domain-containing protein [Massilia litorea]